jgi:hypothetical protein
MGLGKTRTAIITALALHRSFSTDVRDEIDLNSSGTLIGPATSGIFMIICPKAVVHVWMQEIDACSKYGKACHHYSRPAPKERPIELFNFLERNGYTKKEINSNEYKYKPDRVVFILESFTGMANTCSLLGKNKTILEARKKMRGSRDLPRLEKTLLLRLIDVATLAIIDEVHKGKRSVSFSVAVSKANIIILIVLSFMSLFL